MGERAGQLRSYLRKFSPWDSWLACGHQGKLALSLPSVEEANGTNQGRAQTTRSRFSPWDERMEKEKMLSRTFF